MTLCQSIITQNVIYINRFGVFLFGAYLTIAIFEDGLLVVFKVCTKSKTLRETYVENLTYAETKASFASVKVVLLENVM